MQIIERSILNSFRIKLSYLLLSQHFYIFILILQQYMRKEKETIVETFTINSYIILLCNRRVIIFFIYALEITASETFQFSVT